MLSLLKKTRSVRRFVEDRRISREELFALGESLRLVPSAGNLQRVRVLFVSDADECERVFHTLRFAAYLKDWDGPAPGQRPAGYAVLLTEAEPNKALAIDIGIAAEAMLLTARDMGLGGCIFASFNAEELGAVLPLGNLIPNLVIALGVSDEKIEIVDAKDGKIEYYRDENDTHTVPKRPLAELLVREI